MFFKCVYLFYCPCEEYNGEAVIAEIFSTVSLILATSKMLISSSCLVFEACGKERMVCPKLR